MSSRTRGGECLEAYRHCFNPSFHLEGLNLVEVLIHGCFMNVEKNMALVSACIW